MDSITNVKDIETAQILHTKIAAGLNLMGQGLFETCINLKKMHDGKYFKALGYETLEDYTKDRFDIGKDRHTPTFRPLNSSVRILYNQMPVSVSQNYSFLQLFRSLTEWS